MKRQNNLKYLALGVGATALVGGLAYYFFANQTETISGGDLYSDEQMIKVAKIFKKEFFPAYEIAAGMSRQMLAMFAMQTGRNPNQLPKEIKEQIFEQAIGQSKLSF